jgi:hypothetical protein
MSGGYCSRFEPVSSKGWPNDLRLPSLQENVRHILSAMLRSLPNAKAVDLIDHMKANIG